MIRLIPISVVLAWLPQAAADNMDAFPAAEEGQARHVLHLPPLEDESAAKVELIIGKMVKTDPVNRFFLAGEIEAVTIKGWGFTRYVVEKIGPMAGTLMAPPPGTEKVERFIPLRGAPYLVRYNSKLPIVVYVPEGAEVRYRIWRGDGEPRRVDKG
jgi:ecotin